MIQEIIQTVPQIGFQIIVGDYHLDVSTVQGIHVPFPTREQIRSQTYVAVGGKFGGKVESVLNQAVTFVSQNHCAEGTGMVLRYGQETFDSVAESDP
jgi:hypothetical protein